MSSAPTAASEVDQPTFLSSPSPVTAAPTVHITGTAAIVPGNLFGPYRILKKLGEGGMGAVYQAMHTRLDKFVALKVLPSQVTRHQGAVARFEREMRAVGKLEHPHIVRAMDAGEIDGTHYLAMEYVEGTDLAQLVKNRGSLSVVNGCKAIRQAALALAAAHAAGLVHRDLKPANLLVGRNGQIKLLDLGLARLADDTGESSELTSAGQAFGTPDFMAPEQWEDAHTTDARADLYALGCTLYYVLTGRPPYGGDRYKTTVAKFRGHVNDPIPDLAEARPDVPATVVDIYQKLMAKSPADRYQTAAEVVASLQPFTSSKVANPDSVGTPGTGLALLTGMETSAELSPSAASLPDTLPSASSGRSGRRPRTLVMAGAGGLLLLAAGIIVTITNKDGIKSTFNVPEGIELDVDAAPGSRVAIKQVTSPASSHTQSTTLASQSDWHGWPADAPKPAIAPFDAAQARKHQEEWAAYLKVPVEYTNSIGMKLRLIPPGEFLMGSTREEIETALKVAGEDEHWKNHINSEGPQHKVILTQPVYVGVTEVTQAQYEQVMGTNPSYFSAAGDGKDLVANLETGNHPVEMTSWNDAAEFCSKLSERETLKPFDFRAGETVTLLNGTGYRLPTEAEWEYSCRAGTTTRFWSGDADQDLDQAGWFGANSGGRTHAAGELKANPFGLADFHGNVWEWVQDGRDASYYGQFSEKPAINPSSPFPHVSQRVLRGGNSLHAASFCRSSLRNANVLTHRYRYFGFRVSLSVDAVRQSASNAASKSTFTTTLKTVGWLGWPVDAPPPAIAPFNVDEAKAHQVAWAKYLEVPVEYENSIGMKFRLIPPGEFLMGSTPDEIEAALKVSFDDQHWRECIQSGAPQHKVILTRPIFVGITEVTQMQYERVTATNPSYFSATGTGKEAVAGLETGHYPAEMVSWNGATQFCAKLSEQESLKPSYRIVGESVVTVEGDGYRLPTEAEWEFVCRAGTTTQFWSGDDPDSLLLTAWFGGNSGAKTHPVGEADANPFGLFDVHGNVWEWVQDSWDPAYYGTFTDRAAVNPMPSFSAGDQRVVRGGHWSAAPTYCRASLRFASLPTSQTHLVGFRTVLTVDAVRQANRGDKISGDEGGVPPMRPGPQGVITAPLAIDEPPPLKEWLKGRKVLTVAQDGTGQFKTIQAALDALQPGEVVKVLDKGPYPERLVMDSLPKDTGLISEVQTVLDLPEWKLGWNEPGTRPGQTAEIFQGHWLHRTNGFRLHGFELRFPPAVGTYSDGKWHRRMSANQTREFVLENCLIRALGEVDGEPIIFNSWDGEDREGMKVVVRDCVIEGSVTIMNPDKPRFSEPGLSTAVVTRNLFAGIEIDHYLIASGQSFEAFVVRQNVFSGKASNDIVLSKMGECTSLEWGQNTSVSETAIAVVSAMPLQTMTIRNNLRSRPSLVRLFPGAGRKTERVPTPWTIDHNRYPDPPDESVSANLLPRAPGDLSVPPRFLSTVPQESDYLRLDPNDPLANSGAGGEWPSYIGALPPGPAPQEGDWFTRLRERWGDLKPGTPAEQE